jgi:hypothetical protein
MTEQSALELGEEWGVAVFPCGFNKQPLTDHGFKDATRNLEQISEWWSRWPDALVGVPTGVASGLLVVDIDPDGAKWYGEHSADLGVGSQKVGTPGFSEPFPPSDANAGSVIEARGRCPYAAVKARRRPRQRVCARSHEVAARSA